MVRNNIFISVAVVLNLSSFEDINTHGLVLHTQECQLFVISLTLVTVLLLPV